MEELAVLECDPAVLSQAISTAALTTSDTGSETEMFIRVDESGIDTPASAVGAGHGSFCTVSPALFDDFGVTEPTMALFQVEPILDWLAYFDTAESLTVSIRGETGAEYASQFQLRGEHQTVTLDCVNAPALLDDVEITLPDRFADDQFLDEAGDPVPTTVETTAAELDRLIEAAARCRGADAYPLAGADGELFFELTGERTRASGTLAGTVTGPDFNHEFGSEFARVVRAVEGQLTLQTGPENPLAVHHTEPGVTYRYVLTGAA